MRKSIKRLVAITTAIALCFSGVTVYKAQKVEAASKAKVYVDGTLNYRISQEMLKLVNKARKKRGKRALKMDKGLTKAAATRAVELSIYVSEKHKRPNGKDRASLNHRIAWENTCEGINTAYYYSGMSKKKFAKKLAKETFDSLMSSPHHKEGILKASFKSIGIGAFIGNSGGDIYVAQEFSSSRAKKKFKSSKVKKVVKKVSTKTKYLAKKYTKVDGIDDFVITKRVGVGKKIKAYVVHKNPYDKQLKTHLHNKSFKFKSSNKKIATVNSKGVIKGIKPGTVTITIRVKKCSKIKYTLKIKVLKDAPDNY